MVPWNVQSYKVPLTNFLGTHEVNIRFIVDAINRFSIFKKLKRFLNHMTFIFFLSSLFFSHAIIKGLLKVIGSIDKIMAKCDHDKDGKISIEQDMEATKETCLATCFKRKAFKSAFFAECDL
eukprot:scaffold168110_cov58-Attheya_sp.AAC.3